MDDDLNAIFPPAWSAPDGPWARQADGLYLAALQHERRPRWDGDGGLQWLHEAPQVATGAALAGAARGEYEALLARLVEPCRGAPKLTDDALAAFPRSRVAAWDRAVRARRSPLGTRAETDALAGVVARLAAQDPRVQVGGGAVACVFCLAEIVPAGTRGALHEMRLRVAHALPLDDHAPGCVWRDAAGLVAPGRNHR